MCTNQVLHGIGEGTLKSIMNGYEYVSASSKHVGISYNHLEKLIATLADGSLNLNNSNWLESTDIVNFSKLTLDDAIEFLIFFHNINFSYWGDPKWKIITKEHGILDGSQAMLYICLRILKDNGFNPENISRLTFHQFSKYFEGKVQIPLLRERYYNTVYLYSDICKMLRKNNLNCSYDLLRCYTLNDKVLFGFIVHNFRELFEDSSIYNNRKIDFYKRAQLLTSDIINLLNNRERLKVATTDLLGCADYKIPQFLHEYGVLIYDEDLSLKIANKEPIPKHHCFEVEIRANTLKVIDLISSSINVSRIEVNDRLWLMSQKIKSQNKDVFPYHLTRTTAY